MDQNYYCKTNRWGFLVKHVILSLNSTFVRTHYGNFIKPSGTKNSCQNSNLCSLWTFNHYLKELCFVKAQWKNFWYWHLVNLVSRTIFLKIAIVRLPLIAKRCAGFEVDILLATLVSNPCGKGLLYRSNVRFIGEVGNYYHPRLTQLKIS